MPDTITSVAFFFFLHAYTTSDLRTFRRTCVHVRKECSLEISVKVKREASYTEREREKERKKREGEGKETERKRKGRNKNEKEREREIRVNVSAGGQKWQPHLASQGPRFFAACLANAGRLHERLRTASVA